MAQGAYIVVDFGKTLSKVSLWTRDGCCLERLTRANQPQAATPYIPLDTAANSAWLLEALATFAAHPVEAIIPVSHGAAVAGIRDGALAFPCIDYEWDMPADRMAAYRAQRDSFALTGSPALPAGLNFGAQLHYLDAAGALDGVTLMPYAQYWAWLLTGVAVSEVTSLGCHSDLWNPSTSDFSHMAKTRGWAQKFAPLVRAGDTVGILRPEIAQHTGLPVNTRVLAGLHDSNAALLAARGFAEIADNEATVLSTGTWFIAMRLAGEVVDSASLPEARDCLVNVDAYGRPVPSARFMGGREIETLIEIDTRRVDVKPDQPALLAAVDKVVSDGAMVLPSLAPGNGPFPRIEARWLNRPECWFERRAAACLYAALVASTSLDLIGSKDRLLVEGRFAEAEVFVRALASLRPGTRVYTANAHNDVSFGALRLIDPALRPQGELVPVTPLGTDLTQYRAQWCAAIEHGAAPADAITQGETA
ncbi:FGGY-family carbohydrate kinase [Novosphingobium aquae]|uniref:FGGY family carbohydrate kinase n=1 Tax=Novosphingobium aquae TaxID=3133435 RepID=A0ABU8S5L8_9SPHN